ncbi:CapA family protein [Actinoplanes hulinensis]|uniref:CapA family protein n=1 Tax=Actinoplanes hulinensis TaxID=1144547 RepID=A0ABS7AXQ7_9ACTN|nr:CapA family protein [Actinoplanes hulinensis]MBW6433407.1 CapA family protein [Actinoplanes hulinensis]
MPDHLVTVLLGGDVMTGRGVDQILAHPGDPRLWERHVRDARTYIELAEAVNGPIPLPVDAAWPWGDALPLLDDIAPDARVINLETSITCCDEPDPVKGVHYRMAPANIACLTAVRPDACALANNHVLDFGLPGLAETLTALVAAEIPAVGAGRDADLAERSTMVPVAGGGRVVVFSFGTRSSGIPQDWAATADRAGVNLLAELSDVVASAVADQVQRVKRPGDLVVASIHWGSNWGYEVTADQVGFAHRLIDGGVDVVHGHSSHHPRPIEVHHGKLILYGCGDLIDDYEGISGYEEYRDDLRLLYFASIDQDTGRLVRLRMAPMQARRMRLHHATPADAERLRCALGRISRPFGMQVTHADDGMLHLQP